MKPTSLAERAADRLIAAEAHDDLTYAYLSGKLHGQAFLDSLRELHESFIVSETQRDPDDMGDSTRSMERDRKAL